MTIVLYIHIHIFNDDKDDERALLRRCIRSMTVDETENLLLEILALGKPSRDGGADRDRTDDILLAKQALSQLSYSPSQGLKRGGPGKI